MLRLSIYWPTPQGVTQTRSIGSLQLIKHHKSPFRRVLVVKSALKDGGGADNGGTSSFQGSSSSWQPDSEIGIPFEQRPVCEIVNVLSLVSSLPLMLQSKAADNSDFIGE
ncbi:hypothetical protein LINPERPRIM_LOCUS31550 [Linum perenne]